MNKLSDDHPAMMSPSTAFFYHVEAGLAEVVQELLARFPDIAEHNDRDGLTALHIAVGMNDLAMARMLVQSGVPFRADRFGRWPSVVAAQCRVDEDLADFILKAEAEAVGASIPSALQSAHPDAV